MSGLLGDLIFAFFVFLPAGVANMGPIFASRLPGLKNWNTPIDFGKSLRGKRIFGSHKTWRGLLVGSLLGALAAIVEFSLYFHPALGGSWVFMAGWAGFLLGFGALAGDSVESYFKRRAGVADGKSWFPFDQLDYIIGGLVFSYPILQWKPRLIVLIFVLYFGLHIVAGYIGYLLRLKKTPI